MAALFQAFGLDWHLLLVNLLNFGLLLLALWYFLYGPLTKALETRRQKIIQSVDDAKEAERQLKEISEARAGMIADAGKEADMLIADARLAGTARQKELIAQGEAAAASTVAAAEAQAREMKQKSIEESKQEVAKLIVLGMEKLAKQK